MLNASPPPSIESPPPVEPPPPEPPAEDISDPIGEMLANAGMMINLLTAVCMNPECCWEGPWWRLKMGACPFCNNAKIASASELDDSDGSNP